MTARLADLGRSWDELVDNTLAWQAELLRRTAGEMAEALDRSAMRDIEGATDWRDLRESKGRFPA